MIRAVEWRRRRARRRLECDPTWYRTGYLIAVQNLLAADGVTPAGSPPELPALATFRLANAPVARPGDAERLAWELLTTTRANLARAGWRYPRRPPTLRTRWWRRLTFRAGPLGRAPTVAAFLDSTLEPATVVLIWSARVAQNEEVPLASVTRPDPAGIMDRRSKDPNWLESYLADLVGERPPRMSRSWSVRATAWLGYRRWQESGEPSYRVRYNLACLYSRLATRAAIATPSHKRYGALERSAKQLERALVDTGGERRAHLARWAWRDPGLAGLRAGDLERFREIAGPKPKTASAKAKDASRPPRTRR